MQAAIGAAQMLDGHHMLAVQHGDETDAGIGGAIGDAIAVAPANQDGASPAITLGTAFLGAPEGSVEA